MIPTDMHSNPYNLDCLLLTMLHDIHSNHRTKIGAIWYDARNDTNPRAVLTDRLSYDDCQHHRRVMDRIHAWLTTLDGKQYDWHILELSMRYERHGKQHYFRIFDLPQYDANGIPPHLMK